MLLGSAGGGSARDGDGRAAGECQYALEEWDDEDELSVCIFCYGISSTNGPAVLRCPTGQQLNAHHTAF